MLLMNNPQSREKQCAAVKDGEPYPEGSRRADESVATQYVKREEYKKLVERCNQLKQQQHKNP